MRTFIFNRHRTIRLRRGQRVLLICGFFIRKITRVRLKHGEFVKVTCTITGNTITVSCGKPMTSKGTIHLKRGDAVIIRCSSM